MKRIVQIATALIILAGIVVLCVLRWDAWFGNPPEEAYSVARYPHNVTVTFGEKATSERTISWRCDTVVHPSYLIYWTDGSNSRDTVITEGRLVFSRAGKAAFYNVTLSNLRPATYCFELHSGLHSSEVLQTTVEEPDRLNEFVVLGDIQDKEGSFYRHVFASVDSLFPDNAFIVQAGDLIERPTDEYWQLFFNSLPEGYLHSPFVAATGNHEYLKGIYKHIDSRWTSIFYNPINGPERAAGRSYFIDFPLMRLVVLDTNQLHLFSDYTRASAWLKKVLGDKRSDDRWKVVVMHHSVHSAGMGRYNPLVYAACANALKNADAVFAGHDHNYARRVVWENDSTAEYISYVVTTSEKSYVGKLSTKDDRVLTAHPVAGHVVMNDSILQIDTWRLDSMSLYDRVILHKDRTLEDCFINMPECIDLPDRFVGEDSHNTRRFMQRRAERMNR